ncbi:MAG: hypothetical protein ACYTFG_06245 [Planctomycetota bacterium]
MKDRFFLSWSYVSHHRGKTALMAAAITLTIWLPFTAHALIGMVHGRLLARAEATPLVAGSRGSNYDLVLHALYFSGSPQGTLPVSEVRRLGEGGRASPVPLYVRHTARGFPLVGTYVDYFELRGLTLLAGRLPMRLGDAVVGARMAAKLGLAPGDKILTDPKNVFDIAGSYPLLLRITGILKSNGTVDDSAVFADIKTAWIVDGLCHGHKDVVREGDTDTVLKRTDKNITASAALPSYTEITDDNIEGFHFHGDREAFPVTAILAWPRDEKSAVILRGRYVGAEERTRLLVPTAVVGELMGAVFRIKRLFDAYFGFVLAADLLFLALIVTLSLKLRRRERRTMFMVGCSRMTVFWLLAFENLIILASSIVLAAGLAGASLLFVPEILELILTA